MRNRLTEVGGKRDEKGYKTFEEEIKYIQDNEKDWRSMMKKKN
jgi:hypothetical protein